MKKGMRERLLGKELKYFVLMTIGILLIAAFLYDSPRNIALSMKQIIISRDALITDYFELAGIGASLFNAALVLGICTALVISQKIPFTGPTMAALFINVGYGFWGKNALNILPLLLGTYLYARMHQAKLGRYIYTALFGTCLAPFVTELVYLLPFSRWINLVIAILVGILAGFLLPPLSTHTASMHMGYTLFNVGYSSGLLAFVFVCVMRSFGLESKTTLIWKKGMESGLLIGLLVYFFTAFLFGLWISRGNWSGFRHIFKHPGRAVADFVLMDGQGATLMNMALVGFMGLLYILLIGGDLSGPVIGSILMQFGFAAFGAHGKNYLPVLTGVYLFSWISGYQAITPGMQLAALFGVGLSPIAGQFGIFPGIFAGMLHSAVVMCTASLYGGLNLYNNGFSAGWVAIIMVPTIESFMKHFENQRKKGSTKQRKEG